MLNRSKSDKGVTLIALVITIAVLLILAGVSITAITDDSGILSRTNELSESANTSIEQNTQELNNMTNELDYVMNPWVQNKTEVTKKLKSGTVTLNVGDNYTYDCGVEGYTGGWKVLGAENGKLLIMSTVDVGTLGLKGIKGDGTTSYPAGYTNGIEKLNEMCETYGRNARSITVEDVNRVTGYVPEHKTISITSENKYYYDGDTSNQSSTTTGTNAAYAGTYGLATALGITNGNPVKGNAYYYYYPNTLTTSNSGTTVGIATTSKAYKLLFRNATDSANCSYWLASKRVYASSKYANLGMRYVGSAGYVDGYYLWDSSHGDDYNPSFGVRAVVPID